MSWLDRTVCIVLGAGITWPLPGLAQGQGEPMESSQVGQSDIKMRCKRRLSLLNKDGKGALACDGFELVSSGSREKGGTIPSTQ